MPVIQIGQLSCEAGAIVVATSASALCRVGLGDRLAAVKHDLVSRFGRVSFKTMAADQPVMRAVSRYLQGSLDALAGIRLDPVGTQFQQAVWSALVSVPPGRTVSYGELAAMAGRAGASRAVGNAVGRNPIPIFVPCHRVIRSDGSLGGFSSGLGFKRWLLAHEGISVS